MMKISLAQTLPMNLSEMAAFVRTLLATQHASDLAVSRWVLFPEHSLRAPVFRGRESVESASSPFKELLQLSDEIGILLTAEEHDASNNSFITTLVFDHHKLIALYRKQRATITGLHCEDNSGCLFSLN
jgi:predicted amidohydrolase